MNEIKEKHTNSNLKRKHLIMQQLKQLSLLVTTILPGIIIQNLFAQEKKEPISQPLVSHIYTADPSAHVFKGRIYIYPSHDTATGIPEDDLGSHACLN